MQQFQFRQFTIRQDRCAMKVGTDGTLLGAWASVPLITCVPSPFTHHPPRILDIGTGTGLIALMMAQRFTEAEITGIDIDSDAAAQARENVADSPFADRIGIVCGDIKTIDADNIPPFDAIVCNPPFFSNSLHSPDAQRTLARHATTLTFRQLMGCVWHLLADGGEFSVVIPAEGKSHLEGEATLAGFFKVRQCAVRTTPVKAPRRYLLAFRKHSAPVETTELIIGLEAYKELTRDFYLSARRS